MKTFKHGKCILEDILDKIRAYNPNATLIRCRDATICQKLYANLEETCNGYRIRTEKDRCWCTVGEGGKLLKLDGRKWKMG